LIRFIQPRSGILSLLGIAAIAYSIAVIIYLNRGETDAWFRTA
jgi:hypothetical protein